MRVLASMFFIFASLASGTAYGVCMTELDGDAYGCLPMHHDSSAVRWCQEKHGENFRPYVTDNYCTKELAATLRGETYTPTRSAATEVVEAACLTYEQGMEAGCDYYNYDPAQRYCARNYGNRYIPFVPDSGACSLEKAAKLRGEVSGDRLVEGLSSSMDEIETIMTMIDREGLNNSLGGFESKRPKIGNEFYNQVVKALMAKMNSFKERIYENGQLNVPLKDENTLQYLKYAFRYLSVLGRLYKVYAYVAHENHIVLKTYTFKNLDYLNLTLKKEHALEILAQVNYRAETVNNGRDVEFVIGQQERQTFEYMAMQDPRSKKDYAKLISFMGVRENLTNLWGVQRMTPNRIANERVRSCGNFLSFRPGSFGRMEQSSAYKELFEYDVFYNDYVPRWEELVTKSLDVSILTSRSALDMGDYVLRNVPELKRLLTEELERPLTSRDDFMEQAAQDAPMLIQAENQYWTEFSYNHFSTVVLPGDGVLEKNAVLSRIAEEAYKKRLEAIVDVFVASYLWVSDAAIEEIENEIRWFAGKYLKEDFEQRLKRRLAAPMSNYNNPATLARENREQKEKETYEAAKKAVVAVNVLDAIENEALDYRKMTTLEPASMEELMMLFQHRVENGYLDLKQTLAHDEDKAKMLGDFFKEVAEAFKNRFLKNGELQGSKSQRIRGLREIAFKAAKRWHAKHPFDIVTHRLRNFPLARQDNTRVDSAIPVYRDGTPAAMSNYDFLKNLPDSRSALRENYVVQRDNTNVYLGATRPIRSLEAPRRRTRSNPDGITAGTVSRPVEVVSPGLIKTEKGYTRYDHSELTQLYKNFDILSERAKRAVERKGSDSADKSEVGRSFIIRNKAKFLFRALEALRLQNVGMSADPKSFGRFARDEEAQKLLANNIVSQAYQVAPILRNELTWEKKVIKYCFTRGSGSMYRCDTTKTVTMPLLEKIGSEAYSRDTNKIDGRQSKALIAQAISNAIRNTPNKLSKFCDVNYLNYKNDPDFKDVFKASKFLRATLRSGIGQSEETLNRLNRFDSEIKKEIRGRWEAWNEDFFEPALHILGTAAIIALGVVLILGTGGAATPGVLGGFYAVASTFLAVEFFVSFPLVVGSLYSRMNTHFIEVPANLKFQESLATSQVDFSKVVDWDMLKQDKKANKTSQMWTIGLMPLDFFYGAMLARHVQKEVGVVGRAAYQRLTGAKLRGWSAPPKTMLSNPRFSELRRKIGLRKALGTKLSHTWNRVKSFTPKYQAVPENMIRSTALRMGIVRKANSLRIGNKPWAILKDVTEHSGKLNSRLRTFETYVQTEAKVIREVKMKGMLRPGELLRHFQETAVYFVPATLWRRIKNLDGRGIVEFFTKFDEVWGSLKKAQGKVLKARADSIDEVADKLRDFQEGVRAGHYKGDNMMEEFLNTLTDNQILALEEVAKKSNGIFRNFKKVFKDYQHVAQGLKPISYLSAHSGQQFGKPVYSSTYVLDGEMDPKYAFKSDEEDLIKFYESMMKNNGVKTEEMLQVRNEVEDQFSRNFRNFPPEVNR